MNDERIVDQVVVERVARLEGWLSVWRLPL